MVGAESEWASYLSSLAMSDPEEYQALLADMKAMASSVKGGSTDTEGVQVGAGVPDVKVREEVSQDEREQILMPGEVQAKGIKVFPSPGFVIKTKDSKGDKVFVNVCQSSQIQPMAQKKKLNDKGEEEEGLGVPLSLGPPMPGQDNKGQECTVFDIIVNPKVITDAMADKSGTARSFLCNLAIEYVEQKYKLQLDKKIKLPKTKYKGDINNIPFQLIREKKVIEEVEAPEIKKEKKISKVKIQYDLYLQSSNNDAMTPCEAKLQDPTERPPCNTILFTAHLPLLQTKPNTATQKNTIQENTIKKNTIKKNTIQQNAIQENSIRLALSENQLLLKVKSYAPLEIYLPYRIDVNRAGAEFDLSSMVLKVEMVLLEEQIGTGPDVGSKAWLLANAIDHPTPIQKENQKATEVVQEAGEEELAEDRFHLKDLMSQHINAQRQENKKKQLLEIKKKEMQDKKELEIKKQKEREKMVLQVKKELNNESSNFTFDDTIEETLF